MTRLRLRHAALAASICLLPLVAACDQAPPAQMVDVRYQVGPAGQFGAQEVAYVEYTNTGGQTVREENVSLPFDIDVEVGSGTEVRLEAQVQAPASQSGLQIAIRADGQLLGSDSESGFDSNVMVTNTLSLTRTLP